LIEVDIDDGRIQCYNKNIMKKFIFIFLAVVVGFGAYLFYRGTSDNAEITQNKNKVVSENQPKIEEPAKENVARDDTNKTTTIIGNSAENRKINAYHYGIGDTEILFVGGIHGGYSWNTALVAYEMMGYLHTNPDVIPVNIKVTVIPVLNPDGLYKVVGEYTDIFSEKNVSPLQEVRVSGRFNANNVDLNRNFDCDWQQSGVWQNKKISGGKEVFSEPESLAVKDYIETKKPKAVIIWYSAAGGVFASSCHNGILPETRALMDLYSNASGYLAYDKFDFYELTGDMANWLAKEDIPAISVLLTDHTATEWSKNKAGINAIIGHYAK
jgi:hypothetical protein